ncbi:hypothetical protein Tsubulata_026698 [Turnera subulata]|uniref:F-box domain-containing protein n=1 Tax=Turnera subulata TaxID=218843 RepID=A0A9Q0GHP2_9ROSI|nr:hypothetical protein Tsubulata_026698 [Turnera subulata]
MSDSSRSTLSSSSSPRKRESEEGSDGTASSHGETKHNKNRAPDNRLVTDQATPMIDMEQLVTSTNMAAAQNRSYLPPEIVEEILDLLPIKSINRFRSLSKSLCSLLAIKYKHKVQKLLYYPYISEYFRSTYGISSDDPGLFTGVVLSVLPGYSGDVKNQGYMAPELSGPRWEYASVGSCNGLVCLQATNHDCTWETFVWNPFTNICRKLPDLPSSGAVSLLIRGFDRNLSTICGWKYAIAYGFGYDSASDDYKVIVATGPHPDDPRRGDGVEVEIFSLKTGSWKKLENPDECFQDIEHLQYFKSIERERYLHERNLGFFLNGALHWGRAQFLPSGEETHEIFAFDLGKERFYPVPNPPKQTSPGSGSHYSVGVVGGYLSCLFEREETYTVWAMKEYCNEASWVPFISYTSSSGNGKVDGRLTYECNFIPRSFKDGRYMMLHCAQGEIHVLKYWNDCLEESDEAEKYSKKIEFYRVFGNEALPYTETLTSPYAS